MQVNCTDCKTLFELKTPYKCPKCKTYINPYLFQKPQVYEKIKEIRSRKDLTLRPNKFLKTKIEDIFGKEQDLRIRYYQVQGILHLLAMRKMLLGDATGIGKTLQTILAYSYFLEKDPSTKGLIVAPKSAGAQWESEFSKFTNGIKVLRVTSKGGVEARKDLYQQFIDDEYNVLILNYHTLVRDWAQIVETLQKNKLSTEKNKFTIIYDEAAAFKTINSKTWEVVQKVSALTDSCYALTATPIKNRLEEIYGIYRAIYPNLFPGYTTFLNRYCKTKLMRIKGNRKIPLVIGYKNLEEFRNIIDPYYLGRKIEDIGEQLPDLSFKDIRVEMAPEQVEKYKEALAGLMTMADGSETEVTKLTQITYCQEIVSNLGLLGLEGQSTKEEEFFRLIEEEFQGEKVIVHTRFRSWIDILENRLIEKKIPVLRVTGAENEEQRELNKLLFLGNTKKVEEYYKKLEQEKKASRIASHVKKYIEEKVDPKVILLNKAGIEALNLQSARIMIVLDIPISYGDFIQLIGRPRRLDSQHSKILIVHLLSTLPEKYRTTTIDEKMLKIIRTKKNLNDFLFGKDFDFQFEGDMINDIYKELKADALKGLK